MLTTCWGQQKSGQIKVGATNYSIYSNVERCFLIEQYQHDIFQSIFKESQLIVFTKCLTSVQKTTPTISPHTHTQKKQTNKIPVFVPESSFWSRRPCFRHKNCWPDLSVWSQYLTPLVGCGTGKVGWFFSFEKTNPKKAIQKKEGVLVGWFCFNIPMYFFNYVMRYCKLTMFLDVVFLTSDSGWTYSFAVGSW